MEAVEREVMDSNLSGEIHQIVETKMDSLYPEGFSDIDDEQLEKEAVEIASEVISRLLSFLVA